MHSTKTPIGEQKFCKVLTFLRESKCYEIKNRTFSFLFFYEKSNHIHYNKISTAKFGVSDTVFNDSNIVIMSTVRAAS